MEATTDVERMPLRDRDLRAAAADAEVRPGDPIWGCLVELQRRRDRDRAERPASAAGEGPNP